MQQKRWSAYTGKVLAVGILSVSSLWIARPEAATAQFGEGCNIYGCSKSPGVECNPFGCPKPGAGECTPYGCPASPPSKPDDGSNRPDDRGRSNRPISGECMDRVMYREVRAQSGPDPFGDYRYNLPSDLKGDQIRKAGFEIGGTGYNEHKQPVVRIQVKSPEEAAKACR